MRFNLVAITFSGAALASLEAESTVYNTEMITINSCGPGVTNCPPFSASISSVPVLTKGAPGVGTGIPSIVTPTKGYFNSTLISVPSVTVAGTGAAPPVNTNVVNSTSLVTGAATVCTSTVSVKTISTSATTVVLTAIYETVSVSCLSSTVPSGAVSTTGSGPSSIHPVTAAAANVTFSGVLVAVAGIVAVFLA